MKTTWTTGEANMLARMRRAERRLELQMWLWVFVAALSVCGLFALLCYWGTSPTP